MNNFFSHDSNARNSDKIINLRAKMGVEGYGIYFMILERLREEPQYMSVKDYNMLAFDFRVDAAKVKAVVENFGLFAFTDDGKCFYSESFMVRMQLKDEKSKKSRESALKRWGKSEFNANAMQTQCKRNASKEKEIKDNISSNESILSSISSTTPTARAYEGENDDTRDTAFGKSIEEKEKSCAKKEKELTRLPADAIEYIRIERVAEYLKSDQCWLDALCMNRHLRMNYVLSKIDEFAVELQLQGETEKDKNDCKRHFNNWLRKNRNYNEPTTGHRTSNGDISNNEVMQRCQDRVLQRLAREKAREMGQYDDAVADPF